MPVNLLHRLFFFFLAHCLVVAIDSSRWIAITWVLTHCPLSFIIYGIIGHMTCTKSTRSFGCTLIANKASLVYQSVDFIVVQRQSIEIYLSLHESVGRPSL